MKCKNILLIVLLLAILASGVYLVWRWQRSQPPRNIILISIDALRADHLGCYGYVRETSPNIDRFAAQSTRFTRYFTVVPKTLPSMVTFFTGKQVNRHGVVSNWETLPASTTTLAACLPQGFRKAAFVNNVTLYRKTGLNRGFDVYNVLPQLRPRAFANRVLNWLGRFVYTTSDTPLFLWIHFQDPHGPYKPAPEFTERFVNDTFYDGSKRVPIEPPPGEKHRNYVVGMVPKYQVLGDHDEVDYYIAQYDAEIYGVDREVGRILDFLDRRGLLNNSLVIVTADHGESLGENNYYFEHGWFLDEGSIRIPFMLFHPSLQPSTCDQLADNSDFLPTVLELMHLPIPTGLDGVSLAPLLHGREAAPKSHVFCQNALEYGDLQQAIRSRDAIYLVRQSLRWLGNRSHETIGEPGYFYHTVGDGTRSQKNIYPSLSPEKKQQLQSLLSAFTGDMQQTPAIAPEEVDADTLNELKSLGYIE